jgi:streptomycin 6-kinase
VAEENHRKPSQVSWWSGQDLNQVFPELESRMLLPHLKKRYRTHILWHKGNGYFSSQVWHLLKMNYLSYRRVIPCSLEVVYQHFGGTFCLHIQGWIVS